MAQINNWYMLRRLVKLLYALEIIERSSYVHYAKPNTLFVLNRNIEKKTAYEDLKKYEQVIKEGRDKTKQRT